MDQLVFVYKGTEDEKANYDWQDKHKDRQRYSQNITNISVRFHLVPVISDGQISS